MQFSIEETLNRRFLKETETESPDKICKTLTHILC